MRKSTRCSGWPLDATGNIPDVACLRVPDLPQVLILVFTSSRDKDPLWGPQTPLGPGTGSEGSCGRRRYQESNLWNRPSSGDPPTYLIRFPTQLQELGEAKALQSQSGSQPSRPVVTWVVEKGTKRSCERVSANFCPLSASTATREMRDHYDRVIWVNVSAISSSGQKCDGEQTLGGHPGGVQTRCWTTSGSSGSSLPDVTAPHWAHFSLLYSQSHLLGCCPELRTIVLKSPATESILLKV